MSAAPAGAVVRIFYDGAELRVGDVLRTPTGRAYEVLSRRVQQRGAHAGRQKLGCLMLSALDAAEVEARGSAVQPLHWYPRCPRRRPWA